MSILWKNIWKICFFDCGVRKLTDIRELVTSVGFDNVGVILAEDIPYDASLIELCKSNGCGNYGKNYTCPPHIGETDALIQKAKKYKKAVVFQKIYSIEDSFDIEGMDTARTDFRRATQRVHDLCMKECGDFLTLGAGPCNLCPVCGVVEGAECRFPERAVASLESYGIFVSVLAQKCGMKYINGVNTVTYFGAVLY